MPETGSKSTACLRARLSNLRSRNRKGAVDSDAGSGERDGGAAKVTETVMAVGRVFLPAAGFPAGWTRWKAGPRPERQPHNNRQSVLLEPHLLHDENHACLCGGPVDGGGDGGVPGCQAGR